MLYNCRYGIQSLRYEHFATCKACRKIHPKIRNLISATRRANHQPLIPPLIWYQVDNVDTTIIHQIVHMTGKLEMPKMSFLTSRRGILLPTLYVDLHAKPVSLQLPYRQYTNFERKAPNFAKIGCAFYHNLLKVHSIHAIWALHLG